ncbi:MAG: BrnA antitoxin family protein [Chloroflexi bacterium]|nr:BrnA antitoxin family protein [Chloroflexota bacterium]MCI0580831.1 BrnA antitoxin family protein [Chloroflexota bacterium]MCI0648175.1 BrnA antitoxin family protein [Chloroflexota bacterium]MCI0730317.1 BrnA antitoxin family protein [Chloroflexota bacterium]
MENGKKIPKFVSSEEEAAFWDTHDTTEFENEFEAVEVIFADSQLQHGIFVPLEEPFLSQLKVYLRPAPIKLIGTNVLIAGRSWSIIMLWVTAYKRLSPPHLVTGPGFALDTSPCQV